VHTQPVMGGIARKGPAPPGVHGLPVTTYCSGMTDEPGQPDPSGRVRASDAEHEAVVERLRVATAKVASRSAS
jgi:hypothetical protein